MGYAWASRDRLCPMRMVSNHGYHWHRFEIAQEEARRSLRGWLRLKESTENHEYKFERKRWEHKIAPGRLGEWPIFRYEKRKNAEISGRPGAR